LRKPPVLRRVDFYVEDDDDLEGELMTRPGDPAEVAHLAMERYFSLLKATLDRADLTAAEAKAAITLLYEERVAVDRLDGLARIIELNSRSFYHPDLGVDVRSLSDKIDRLTDAEKLAVVDAAETYWWCLTSEIAEGETEAMTLALGALAGAS